MVFQKVKHQRVKRLSAQKLACTNLVQREEICVYEYVYEYGTKSS